MGTDATHNSILDMPPVEAMAVEAINDLVVENYSSSVMKLSRPTLNELGRRLVRPGETVNDAAVEWLEQNGHDLKRSSVYRFAQRFKEVYKRVWGGNANKLLFARLSTEPDFDLERMQDLIKNRVTTLVAQEVMTSDPSELSTSRLFAHLSLIAGTDKGRLERDKLELARNQAEARAEKLEAEVEQLTLKNDGHRRELQRSIEAAKKDVQTAVEGKASKSMTEDQVIAILDRVMKGETS